MNEIPLKRLLFYVVLLSFGPLIYVSFSLWDSFDLAFRIEQQLAQKLVDTRRVSPLIERLQQIELASQGKDSSYVNKYLEAFIPLTGEIDLLKTRALSGFLPDEEMQKRRLEMLTSGQNSFTFVEGGQQIGRGVSGAIWKESIETQTKSVEVSGDDVAEILSRVEGDKTFGDTRPQLFFIDFRIERRKGIGGEYYQLTTKILKREWSKKEAFRPPSLPLN
jgi:hypothetical protein